LSERGRGQTAGSSLGKYISLPRLAGGSLAVALLLLPLYVLVLRPADPDLPRARLLETPPAPGRDLQVAVREGSLAPDFLISSPTGQQFRLSDLRGRAVLINFWASWCGSCLAEMPDIKAVQAELGTEMLSVVAINAGESRQEALRFIDFLDAPFAWAMDPNLAVTDAYGVYGLPLSVFVDAAGVIQALYHGHASREILDRFARAAVNAEPAGEPPFALRFITTIPRERVLFVRREGEGRLVFESRTLRCDASYCAEAAIEPLRSLPGVTQVELRSDEDQPVLNVRFDGRLTDETRVIEVLASALDAHPDPVYRQPLEVRYGNRG
jgi:thiol-disulfide isomerase/thioredoxin